MQAVEVLASWEGHCSIPKYILKGGEIDGWVVGGFTYFFFRIFHHFFFFWGGGRGGKVSNFKGLLFFVRHFLDQDCFFFGGKRMTLLTC